MTKPHRKRYGLGSFFKKAAKKIGRGAKKVWKSPLGKAALIGGGLYSLGGLQSLGGSGMFKAGQGLQRFRNLGSMFKSGNLLGQLVRNKAGKLSLGKMALMGLGTAGAVMPFLGGDDEEEIVEEGWENTPASIASIHQMARDRDPSLSFLPQSPYVQSGFYNAASGGLARLANGGGVAEAKAEQMLKMEYQKYRNQGGTMSYQRFKMMVLQQAQAQGPVAQGPPQMAQPQMAAYGGRIGYQRGGPPGGGETAFGSGAALGRTEAQGGQFGRSYDDRGQIDQGPGATGEHGTFLGLNKYTVDKPNLTWSDKFADVLNPWLSYRNTGIVDEGIVEEDNPMNLVDAISTEHSPYKKAATAVNERANLLKTFDPNDQSTWAQGGRVGAQEGGLMSLGGMEKDYRQEGGFVPLGKEEKADDVPARLSKNEFVFTADAVKAAGGGDIDAGAEVMQNMMTNLEEGGEISEESQGAQGMYNQQQMLQSRMA